MNSLFFNKTIKQESEPDISKIDVSFANENPNLSAAVCGVTGDEVLMLLSDLDNNFSEIISTNSLQADRIQPFYSTLNQGGIKVSSHGAFFGYKKAQNKTFAIQQSATRQAKYVYLNYVTLLNRLNAMLNHAPNVNVKNDISNLKQETILSVATLTNIIRLLSNNQNPALEAITESNNNMSFCNELKSAIKITNAIINGLIRLKRMVNIPQISINLTILTLSAISMHHKLKDMQSFC